MNEVFHLNDFYCHECADFRLCSHICDQRLHEGSRVSESLKRVYSNLTRFGFIILRGYDAANIPETFNMMKSFFNQSIEEKMGLVSKDRARRGYCPMSSENFATLIGVSGKPNDSVEKYRVGPIIEESEKEEYSEYFGSKEGRIHFFPNNIDLFPTESGQLFIHYYRAMERLSSFILALIEHACDIPVNSLSRSSERHTSILAFNHYSFLPLASDGDERVADHTDVSMFTIVSELTGDFSHDINSNIVYNSELQVLNLVTNEWESIHLSAGDFVVNIGDCLKDWSHGLLKSARHRVIHKASSLVDGELRERLTSAFFFSPNYETSLLWPSCEEETKSEPLRYSLWRKQVIAKAMGKLKR